MRGERYKVWLLAILLAAIGIVTLLSAASGHQKRYYGAWNRYDSANTAVVISLTRYAEDNGGRFPDALSQLIEESYLVKSIDELLTNEEDPEAVADMNYAADGRPSAEDGSHRCEFSLYYNKQLFSRTELTSTVSGQHVEVSKQVSGLVLRRPHPYLIWCGSSEDQ